jgi:dolichyl-diphosphooligosaccharide--protein glycosyltransferase
MALLSRSKFPEPQTIALFCGAMLLLVAVRTLPVAQYVFQNGSIVLLGNDPFFNTWAVERIAQQTTGPFDPTGISRQGTSYSLSRFSLWFFVELLGGSSTTATAVMAWYPVVGAVISSTFIYVLAWRLTGDLRIALGTVVVLAFIPTHAMRTGLGFADHHAFEYIWLSLTVLLLVELVRARQKDDHAQQWYLAVAIGLALGLQSVSWIGSPLYIIPFGVYAWASITLSLDDPDLLDRTTPLAVALAVASLVAVGLHLTFGWQTGVVYVVPAILGGVLGLAVAAVIVRRLALLRQKVVFAGGAAIAGVLAVIGISLYSLYVSRIGIVDRALHRFVFDTAVVAESMSLFTGVVDPFLHFGLFPLLFIPGLIWVTWDRVKSNDPGWLVPVVYGWWFFLITLSQRRFGAAFALFGSVFGAVAFVRLTHVLDISRPVELTAPSPLAGSFNWPSARTLMFVGIALLPFLTAGVFETTVFFSYITHDSSEVQTAQWMGEHQELGNCECENGVILSSPGTGPMYNALANRDPTYTLSRNSFQNFIESDNTQVWYNRMNDSVDFVVLRDEDERYLNDGQETSVYNRLYNHYGNRGEAFPGTSHYQAVYESPTGSEKIFVLVEGATIRGRVEPAMTVTADTTVNFPNSKFEYERRIESRGDGWFTVTVPYPGTYTIAGTEVNITSGDVTEGQTVNVTAR